MLAAVTRGGDPGVPVGAAAGDRVRRSRPGVARVGGSRCAAAKFQAAGRYLDGLAKCQAKAKGALGGTFVEDAVCLPGRVCID